MKLIFQGTILADGGKGSPFGLSVSGQKEVESLSFIRASHGRVFDRGNKQITLTWQHTRRFSSVASAQQFAMQHGDEITAAADDLYLTLTGGSSLVLTGTVLQLPELVDYAGVKTVHRYTATGRAVTGGSLPSWSGVGTGIEFGAALLSGGGVHGFATFSVGGSKAVDLQSFLSASAARPTDQKNKLNTLHWEQSRDFATPDAAERFLLLHGQSIPDGVNDLTATLDNGNVVTLADAVVQIPQGRLISATRTVHTYEAIGRSFTSTSDTPAWINPNTGTPIDPTIVYHNGVAVTHNAEAVTHTP